MIKSLEAKAGRLKQVTTAAISRDLHNAQLLRKQRNTIFKIQNEMDEFGEQVRELDAQGAQTDIQSKESEDDLQGALGQDQEVYIVSRQRAEERE